MWIRNQSTVKTKKNKKIQPYNNNNNTKWIIVEHETIFETTLKEKTMNIS